jgi:hypothetical protein
LLVIGKLLAVEVGGQCCWWPVAVDQFVKVV